MALQLPHLRHLARLLPARLCSAEQQLVRRSFAATAQPAEASAEEGPGKLCCKVLEPALLLLGTPLGLMDFFQRL